MQTVMNMKVKFREGFRPFAPAVLQEHVADYFDVRPGLDSPYMLLVAPGCRASEAAGSTSPRPQPGIDKLKVERSTIPAVTHVDYSARLQTVDPARHPLYHRLIRAFHERTGCPVVVNTSFNLGLGSDRLHAARAYETFMASRHRRARAGALHRAQDGAARVGVPARRVTRHDPVLDPLWVSPCCGADLQRGERPRRRAAAADGSSRSRMASRRCSRRTTASARGGDVTEDGEGVLRRNAVPELRRARLGAIADREVAPRRLRRDARTTRFRSTRRCSKSAAAPASSSNFLGITCRRVIGTDLCLNSLRLGEAFRREHDLVARALRADEPVPPVLQARRSSTSCSATACCITRAIRYGGFRSLVPLVRPGGHIVIGLYNTYGRLATDRAAAIFRLTGGRGRWLDPYLRDADPGARSSAPGSPTSISIRTSRRTRSARCWTGSMSAGLEFVRGIPSVSAEGEAFDGNDLFNHAPRGSALDHFVAQSRLVVTGNREGGFFLMIGQRPAAAVAPAGTGEVRTVHA